MAVEAPTQAKPKDKQAQSDGKRRSLFGKAGPAIPYVIGGLLLVGYFVWMCEEMSSEAPGGGAIPLSIFGAVLLGVLAGAASMIGARRGKSKRDD